MRYRWIICLALTSLLSTTLHSQVQVGADDRQVFQVAERPAFVLFLDILDQSRPPGDPGVFPSIVLVIERQEPTMGVIDVEDDQVDGGFFRIAPGPEED